MQRSKRRKALFRCCAWQKPVASAIALTGWSVSARVMSAAAATVGTVVARAEKATKFYGFGDTAVTALSEVDVDIEGGRFTAIMGPSGSGKSTLMHCLAGLDTLSDAERLPFLSLKSGSEIFSVSRLLPRPPLAAAGFSKSLTMAFTASSTLNGFKPSTRTSISIHPSWP